MKYVDFYLSILSADKKNLTATEQYIWEKVHQNDFSWIPERATSKLKDNPDENKETNELLDKVRPLVTEGIMKAKEELQESTRSLSNSLKTQLQDIVSARSNMSTIRNEIMSDLNDKINKAKAEFLAEINKL